MKKNNNNDDYIWSIVHRCANTTIESDNNICMIHLFALCLLHSIMWNVIMNISNGNKAFQNAFEHSLP